MKPKITWARLLAPFTAAPTLNVQAVHRLDLKSPAGVRFRQVTDFEWLACTLECNEPGLLRCQIKGDHAAIAGLVHRSQVELWRKRPDLGVGWYRHFGGLYLSPYWERNPTAKFQLTAPGFMELLAWRIVAWPAETANRSKFTGAPAETIMKTLVSYNAGAQATTGNGRLYDGAISGLSVQADGAYGTSRDWNCFGDNLLKTLQELASVGGGDFDLVKTAAASWEFRWYTGQLGTDRTATVKFALERGNMGEPAYEKNRLSEATVALVGGRGEGANRAFAVRTGPDYDAADNHKEIFVNASNADTTAGLQAAGDRELGARRAREAFSFVVLQTPACAYGRHYFLGDLVTAVNPFTGSSMTLKVQGVDLGREADGREQLDVRLRTP